MYTNIPKPTGTNYTTLPKSPSQQNLYGQAIYGISKYGLVLGYTNIAKPTTTTYTNIAKPT